MKNLKNGSNTLKYKFFLKNIQLNHWNWDENLYNYYNNSYEIGVSGEKGQNLGLQVFCINPYHLVLNKMCKIYLTISQIFTAIGCMVYECTDT